MDEGVDGAIVNFVGDVFTSVDRVALFSLARGLA
jgi:hypothetical protein